MRSLCSLMPLRTEITGRWFAAWVVACLPLSAFGQGAATILEALEEAQIQIIAESEPSVVSIARFGKPAKAENDPTGEIQPPFAPRIELPEVLPSEFGAGVVFEPSDQPGKRFILTMYHVVKGGHIAGRESPETDDLVIQTHNRRSAQVEILAADPRSDLAVLQIRQGEDLNPSDLKPVRFAESSDYKKGQFVFTLGNPYAIARDGSACAGMGMISNIARKPKPAVPGLTGRDKIKLETIHHQGTLLQIDGQLNLGTSGGAVLNRKGELIGLVTAMAALEGYEKSVGYAVPIHKGTKRVITELAHGYEVDYGLLGIVPVTVPFPQGEQPTAVRVEDAGALSPATAAGVRIGDVIYAVNDAPVLTQEDLMREVAFIGPGEMVTVKLYRGLTRQWLTKSVTLTKWPVLNEKEIIATSFRHAWNHLVIDYATARHSRFETRQYVPGVLITHIQSQTPEKMSKVQVGDFITHVDDQPVRTPEEFDAAVQNKKPGTVELRLLDRPLPVLE